MRNIVIDEEFKSLLPALDAETLRRLEENILQNGCRDSLVLWGDVLVDGHNRYAICTKHDLPFNTVDKEFSSREEALIWIISTQVSRRNLTPIQMSHFRGLHYRSARKILKNEGGKNQFNKEEEVKDQNDPKPQTLTTAEFIAKKYNVSAPTVKRDAKISAAIDAIGETSLTAKNMIINGEVAFKKKELTELASMPKDEIAELAMKIEGGLYGNDKAGAEAPARAPTPVEIALKSLRQLDKPMERLETVFAAEVQKITRIAEKTALRKELWTYIVALEKLYSMI